MFPAYTIMLFRWHILLMKFNNSFHIIDIKGRPSSTPYHNCPQYLPKSKGVTCECFVDDLGSPPGVVLWNTTRSPELRLTDSQVIHNMSHVCQLLWNNTFVRSVEYVVNIVGKSALLLLHCPLVIASICPFCSKWLYVYCFSQIFLECWHSTWIILAAKRWMLMRTLTWRWDAILMEGPLLAFSS